MDLQLLRCETRRLYLVVYAWFDDSLEFRCLMVGGKGCKRLFLLIWD
jgi:hypothetical protein